MRYIILSIFTLIFIIAYLLVGLWFFIVCYLWAGLLIWVVIGGEPDFIKTLLFWYISLLFDKPELLD